MMQGRSRFLLDCDGLDAALSSPFNAAMSSLLSTYLRFVPIQAIYMSELHPDRILNKKSLLSRVELVVQDLLKKLDHVYARITSACHHNFPPRKAKANSTSYVDRRKRGVGYTREAS
jgi:hypothetical protein